MAYGEAQPVNTTAAFYEADAAMQVELVRVYGKRIAGDARYYPHHTDPALLAAIERRSVAMKAWQAKRLASS